MTSENRITLTILITLLFGVFSSALVNGITDDNGVHWNKIFYHIELYILVLLGLGIIWHSKKTARESKDQWVWIKEKLEAIQEQGFLVSTPTQENVVQPKTIEKPHSRVIEFSKDANKVFSTLDKRTQSKISSFMTWLQYASALEIVMKNNIRKLHSKTPTDFIVRIGTMRIEVNINLPEGKIVIKKIMNKKFA